VLDCFLSLVGVIVGAVGTEADDDA